MAVTARGDRGKQWLTLENIEAEFTGAAEILRGQGVCSDTNKIICGTTGLEIVTRDDDGNEFKFSAFHGGSHGIMFCFGRCQRFDVVTAKNIAQAFLSRM